MDWNIKVLFQNLHQTVENNLDISRQSFGHPGTKGDASESVWRQLLTDYLPQRYAVSNGHVVDSDGNFSEQIDVIVFDRQYTPLVFSYSGQIIVPAESVYAVIECKQELNLENFKYGQKKIRGVRNLKRTSLAIPTANGVADPKTPQWILGGFVSLSTGWKKEIQNHLNNRDGVVDEKEIVDIGCITDSGYFFREKAGLHYVETEKAATSFLMELISYLQSSATVPMIDFRAYMKWL